MMHNTVTMRERRCLSRVILRCSICSCRIALATSGSFGSALTRPSDFCTTGISPVSGIMRSPDSSRTVEGCTTRDFADCWAAAGDAAGAESCISAAARWAGEVESSRSIGAVATGALTMSAIGSKLALAAPPTRIVWFGRSKACASSASVASAITAVTLSVLPALSAILTSRCAHSS